MHIGMYYYCFFPSSIPAGQSLFLYTLFSTWDLAVCFGVQTKLESESDLILTPGHRIRIQVIYMYCLLGYYWILGTDGRRMPN